MWLPVLRRYIFDHLFFLLSLAYTQGLGPLLVGSCSMWLNPPKWLPDRDWSANNPFVNTWVLNNLMLVIFHKKTIPGRPQVPDPIANSRYPLSEKAHVPTPQKENPYDSLVISIKFFLRISQYNCEIHHVWLYSRIITLPPPKCCWILYFHQIHFITF